MKIKKWIATILACVSLFSIVACTDSSSSNSNGESYAKQQELASESTGHYYSGGLHKVNIEETQNPFVVNKHSDYTVIVGEGEKAFSNSLMLIRNVKNATGYELPSLSYEDADTWIWSEDKKWIVIGVPSLFEQAGLSMPNEDLGETGYCIKSKGNSVFIASESPLGLQGGTLTFMYYTIGYTMYSEDMVRYHKDGKTMPKFDVVDKPDIEYRILMSYATAETRQGMGFIESRDFWVYTDGINFHNSLKYLPYEHYGPYVCTRLDKHNCVLANAKEIPEATDSWKSRFPTCNLLENELYDFEEGGSWEHILCGCEYEHTCVLDNLDHPSIKIENESTWKSTYPNCTLSVNNKNYHPEWFSELNAEHREVCYTAGYNKDTGEGNKASYDLMKEIVLAKMIEWVEATDANTISFSIGDGWAWCDCDACKASLAKYNDCESAAIIQCCNDVALELNKYFQNKVAGTDKKARRIDVLFFAYHAPIEPPVKLVDGEYQPIDESVRCNEYVHPFVAPINASYTYTMYHEANTKNAENIKGWSAISTKIYYWLYETNFYHYLYPYNTWSASIENYRFCVENDATFMMNQGQHGQPTPTGFQRFKDFINSKAEWNVNVNYNDIKKEFFANYFDVAEEPMLKFFNELESHMTYLQAEYANQLRSGYQVYQNIAQTMFWPQGMLETWLEYIDQAFEEILIYKTKDPDLYKVLYDHILLESIFPRYALLDNYPGMFSAVDLTERRLALKADCEYLNVTDFMEGKASLQDRVWKRWGLE